MLQVHLSLNPPQKNVPLNIVPDPQEPILFSDMPYFRDNYLFFQLSGNKHGILPPIWATWNNLKDRLRQSGGHFQEFERDNNKKGEAGEILHCATKREIFHLFLLSATLYPIMTLSWHQKGKHSNFGSSKSAQGSGQINKIITRIKVILEFLSCWKLWKW